MPDTSDKQWTVGDCGRLLPHNLHVLLDTVQNLSLSLLETKKYVIQISNITCKFSCCSLLKHPKFHRLSQNNLCSEGGPLNPPLILHRFWDIAMYWSKIAAFNLPNVYLAPQLGVTPFFAVRKLESMSYRMVLFTRSYVYAFWYNTGVWQTDGRTDRQTDTRRQHNTTPSIASRGEIFTQNPVRACKHYAWRH